MTVPAVQVGDLGLAGFRLIKGYPVSNWCGRNVAGYNQSRRARQAITKATHTGTCLVVNLAAKQQHT
jgi:hypothetical protein